MRIRVWIGIAALLCAVLPLPSAAQGVPSGKERILAAAQRSGMPEPAIAPALAGLDRLQAEGLPTARYVDRMVECAAKGAPPERLKGRAERLARGTESAGRLVEGLRSEGLKDRSDAYEWSAVEDLADTLDTGSILPADLSALRRALKTDLIPRVLAGAEALAHLRSLRVEDAAVMKLLETAPAALSGGEIRRLPSAFFVGRRCGKTDPEILQALSRQMALGEAPSKLVDQWASESGLRCPGAGRGRGPGGGKGMGPGHGQGPGPGGQGRGRGGRGPGGPGG
jgi:hypothetical protein